jgi:membrane-anchored protein YejM (alkaline phosphatase superfamily)
MSQMRKRLGIEVALAAISLAIFVATLAWPEWIEMVFGVDPDQGDGSIEWLIMAVTAGLALVSILFARSDWRHLRTLSEGRV